MLARPGPPNVLLRNRGGGAFEVDDASPVAAVWLNTYQSTWGDYDGDADLYIANDYAPKFLFQNDGHGTFLDVTSETRTADIGYGMGASWGDYDADGDQDLYVTNMHTNSGQRITGERGQDGQRAGANDAPAESAIPVDT